MTDIPDQTKWVKVFQNLASDLKVEVAIAALAEVIVTQGTAANLRALVTLAGLRGIIPNPITASRIDIGGAVAMNQTTVLYTVPANKKLYIASAWISVANTSAGYGTFHLHTRDVGNAIDIYLMRGYTTDETFNMWSNQYRPGLETFAGYDVCIHSSNDYARVYGGISGWLEDA